VFIRRHFRPRMVKFRIFSDDDLRNLCMPVLAIVGGKDVLLDSAQTRSRLERHAPHAEVVFLAEAGHFIPGQTARMIEFLRGSSSTPDA